MMQKEAMTIRTAVPADLPALARLEALCFPPAEAASEASLAGRIARYPAHCWLLEAAWEPVAFVNGMATDEADLRDEMFANAALHREEGAWQMLFGVATLPAWRRQGCAARLLRHVIEETRRQGRQGLVLTCKEALLPFYAAFGFADEGPSASQHGGVPWHQMRLRF